MVVAPPGSEAPFAAALEQGRRYVPSIHRIDGAEAQRLCPVLRLEWLGEALYEPEAMDLDVHAIHQGYLRGLRAKGGEVICDAGATAIARRDGAWAVATPAGRFAAPILVNAAGAWADEVATLAGVRPVGLVPKRRTAATIDPPEGQDPARWPMVIDLAESFYVKPESGRLLISPADETPMPPCDVQPDELDIAIAAERVETATRLAIRHIRRKWAGLRSFVRDKTPVVGPAPDAEGFIWLAGQGGYGIMTSPAMGRATTGLVTAGELPADLTVLGLRAADLLPDRLFRAG
jgi:D-arginine dehydrogenase